MSTEEIEELINQHVYLPVEGGLLIECVVSNVKMSYGKRRVRVIPLAGKGETWVDASRLRRLTPESVPSSE